MFGSSVTAVHGPIVIPPRGKWPASFLQITNRLIDAGHKLTWKQHVAYRHPSALESRPSASGADTLLVITVSGGLWRPTERMLVSLGGVADQFDLALIDDGSECGSGHPLVEREAASWGIFVIPRAGPGHAASRGKGLTTLWNQGYLFFKRRRQYEFLILSNNDLLVPDGTVDRLRAGLIAGWGWLLPVVSWRGSSYRRHRLHDAREHESAAATGLSLRQVFGTWTDSALYYGTVAAVLRASELGDSVSAITAADARHNLNGYFMAFRRSSVARIERADGFLFDPAKLNVGNEDELGRRWRRALEHGDDVGRMGVHHGAFVHHHKGATLSRVNAVGGSRDAIVSCLHTSEQHGSPGSEQRSSGGADDENAETATGVENIEPTGASRRGCARTPLEEVRGKIHTAHGSSKTKRRAIVTGSAGFIGSHVADAAIALGLHVVCVDDLSGGFRRNVPAGCLFIEADVADYGAMREIWKTHGPFEYVYHLAAYAAEGLSHFIRSYNYRNNLVASAQLINLAVEGNATSFVFTSSIATPARPPGRASRSRRRKCEFNRGEEKGDTQRGRDVVVNQSRRRRGGGESETQDSGTVRRGR